MFTHSIKIYSYTHKMCTQNIRVITTSHSPKRLQVEQSVAGQAFAYTELFTDAPKMFVSLPTLNMTMLSVFTHPGSNPLKSCVWINKQLFKHQYLNT